jgi:hypothetical protein
LLEAPADPREVTTDAEVAGAGRYAWTPSVLLAPGFHGAIAPVFGSKAAMWIRFAVPAPVVGLPPSVFA